MMSCAWLRARPGWVVAAVIAVVAAGVTGWAVANRDQSSAAPRGPAAAHVGLGSAAAAVAARRRAPARAGARPPPAGAPPPRSRPPADGIDACVARTVAALSRQ